MSDRGSESAEAALHEYVEVQIAVPDLANPVREQALRSEVEKLPGIQSVRVDGTNLFLTYEPVRILKSAIEDHLRKAGFKLEETAVASASPLVDATAPNAVADSPATGSS